MSIAVVIPWGKPTDSTADVRAKVWNRLLPRWINTGQNLIVAADPEFAKRGKFSVSRAINSAVRHAPPEIDRFACFGADFAPDAATAEWAAAELDAEPWTLLYDQGNAQDEHGNWSPVQMFNSPCVGPIAFTRSTWEKVDGFDERYEGWAYEDVDFWYRLQRDAPRSKPQTYSSRALSQYWHPQSHHDLTMNNPNVRLFVETWR